MKLQVNYKIKYNTILKKLNKKIIKITKIKIKHYDKDLDFFKQSYGNLNIAYIVK